MIDSEEFLPRLMKELVNMNALLTKIDNNLQYISEMIKENKSDFRYLKDMELINELKLYNILKRFPKLDNKLDNIENNIVDISKDIKEIINVIKDNDIQS